MKIFISLKEILVPISASALPTSKRKHGHVLYFNRTSCIINYVATLFLNECDNAVVHVHVCD